MYLVAPLIDDDGYAAGRSLHGLRFKAIVSWGEGWDHVSISTDNRCPTWDEMQMFKEQFWPCDETVMQLHVPRKDWVNCHPHCLHLWRPQDAEIPRPLSIMVGPS